MPVVKVIDQKEDGGAAFPEAVAVSPAGDVYYGMPGMSLRDWFAGQAMRDQIAVLHGSGWSNFNEFQISRIGVDSYKIADSMLKAREA